MDGRGKVDVCACDCPSAAPPPRNGFRVSGQRLPVQRVQDAVEWVMDPDAPRRFQE